MFPAGICCRGAMAGQHFFFFFTEKYIRFFLGGGIGGGIRKINFPKTPLRIMLSRGVAVPYFPCLNNSLQPEVSFLVRVRLPCERLAFLKSWFFSLGIPCKRPARWHHGEILSFNLHGLCIGGHSWTTRESWQRQREGFCWDFPRKHYSRWPDLLINSGASAGWWVGEIFLEISVHQGLLTFYSAYHPPPSLGKRWSCVQENHSPLPNIQSC